MTAAARNTKARAARRPTLAAVPSLADLEASLRDAMAAAGQPFDGRLVYSQLQRYGEKKGELPCWYIAHSLSNGHLAAVFGDWRQRSRHDWTSWEGDDGANQNGVDAAELQRELEAKQAEAERAAEKKRAGAAKLAATMLAHLPTEGESAYLQRKGVDAYGLHFGADQHGPFVAVPVRDVDGDLKGLQRIYDRRLASGTDKLFLPGTAKRGAFHLIGEVDPYRRVWLTEGYATGATVHQVTGQAVAVCFDSGNLKPVAAALRQRYGEIKLIVAADNDLWKVDQPVDPAKPHGKRKHNAGIKAAREIEQAFGARVAVPEFDGLDVSDEPTDFNDLLQLAGADAVKVQVNRPPPWQRHDTPLEQRFRVDDRGVWFTPAARRRRPSAGRCLDLRAAAHHRRHPRRRSGQPRPSAGVHRPVRPAAPVGDAAGDSGGAKRIPPRAAPDGPETLILDGGA